MNIREIFNFGVRRREATSTSEASTAKGVSVRQSRVYASGNNAQQVSAFQHGLTLRANTFARAKVVLERNVNGIWVPEIRDIMGARDYRHLQYLLQQKPNAVINAQTMWRMLSFYRDVEGSAAIWSPGGWQNPYMIYPVHGLSWNCVDNTYGFTCQLTNMSYTGVDASELCIMRGAHSQYSLLGESLIKLANNELSLLLTAGQFTLDTLAKGGTMKMFVSEETQTDPLQGLASLDDKEVHSAVEDIKEQVQNNEDVVFMQGDLKVEPRTQSFQDLRVDMTRTQSTEDIARFLGIPLPLMFCSTNAVYKSIDDAWHTFKELTIQPMLDEVAMELNADVLGESNYGQLRFRFDTTALCLDSESIKATTASSRRAAGITTANEERMYMGLPALPEGNTLEKPTQALPNGGMSDSNGSEK